MTSLTDDGRSLLSLFWTPMVALGCSGPGGPNAQISVSTFGASIVPDQARLLSVVYKANYTHELIAAKGSFSLTALDAGQLDLLRPLGLTSGRGRDKLAGLDFDLTPKGNPVFAGGLGWLECDVLDTFDFGDSTAFLGAVRETRRFRQGAPLLLAEARTSLPEDWAVDWERKRLADIERSRGIMTWRA